MKHISLLSRILLVLSSAFLLSGCVSSRKTFVIGVSQCSEDIWRSKLNQELLISAKYYDGVELRFVSADDDSERQIAQIRQFVRDGVDLLIIAPNQTRAIVPAVEEAYDAGIPVILFDRKIDVRPARTYSNGCKSPNRPDSGKVTAKGKGVHREVESEGS